MVSHDASTTARPIASPTPFKVHAKTNRNRRNHQLEALGQAVHKALEGDDLPRQIQRHHKQDRHDGGKKSDSFCRHILRTRKS